MTHACHEQLTNDENFKTLSADLLQKLTYEMF